MADLLPILGVIFLAAMGVFGDYFIKLSGNGAGHMVYKFFAIGVITYALTAFGWFYVMKHLKLGPLGVYYSLTTVILLLVMGVAFFNEHVNAYDIIGIALGIASILILARFG